MVRKEGVLSSINASSVDNCAPNELVCYSKSYNQGKNLRIALAT